MPVVMIHSLELREEQKKRIARPYTKIFAEETKVPEKRIDVFFGGYGLDGIAAGGVLDSDVPPEVLAPFEARFTDEMKRRGKPKK